MSIFLVKKVHNTWENLVLHFFDVATAPLMWLLGTTIHNLPVEDRGTAPFDIAAPILRTTQQNYCGSGKNIINKPLQQPTTEENLTHAYKVKQNNMWLCTLWLYSEGSCISF